MATAEIAVCFGFANPSLFHDNLLSVIYFLRSSLYTAVSYKGSTLVFEANGVGSVPTTAANEDFPSSQTVQSPKMTINFLFSFCFLKRNTHGKANDKDYRSQWLSD